MAAKPKAYSKEWLEKVMAMTPEERVSLADKDIHSPEGIVATASACAELIGMGDMNITMRVVGSLLGLATAAGVSPFNAFSHLLRDPILRQALEAASIMQPIPGEKGN